MSNSRFDLRQTSWYQFSTSQTFRSWVVIFHLRRPMEFLSLSLDSTPGPAPHMNVLFWGPGDFPVSYSNMDTSWNAWNRQSGSFMVDTGILFCNMIIFLLISWSWYRAWLSPNYELFTWSICNWCGMPVGNAYPFGHLVPCLVWDLLMLQLLRPVFPNKACTFSTYRLEYPSVLSRFC